MYHFLSGKKRRQCFFTWAFDLGVGGQAVEKKMGFETYALGFGGG
jgi:hypothetical protein